jgi:hypothetical protein
MYCATETQAAGGGLGSNVKGVVWGVFLIAVGAAFLLDNLGMLELPAIWNLWPIVLVVIGVNYFLTGMPGSGTTFLLLGAWFFAVIFDWGGLTYANSWPLALVSLGIGTVIAALTGEQQRERVRKEARDE